MPFGIRARLIAWLLAILVPVCVAGWFAIDRIESRLEDRVVADLENLQQLEVARVTEALEDYARAAESLAAGPHVTSFVGATTTARSPGGAQVLIGGLDGFPVMDPHEALPLQPLAQALMGKARATGSEVSALRIVGTDAAVYGETDGFDWVPYDAGLLGRAMQTGTVSFGNAYRDSDGEDRLGLVVPVWRDGDVVGAIQLETRLGPIVDLVVGHEGFGDSSEAHIAQPSPNGDAEFITPLRFARDAAFSKVVPRTNWLPINQSLESAASAIVWSPDYRSVDSVLAIKTIQATGWGLVVKIDEAEALAPVNELKRALASAGLVGVAVVLVGWLLLVDPMSRRLRRTAVAASRVADGDYTSPIDDRGSDEIGRMAGTIDKLATELADDIRIRGEIERRLRRQATHDDLTGLRNRQYTSDRIERLLADGSDGPLSLLFLDLDGFKSINDTYGHGVGDEVLSACGRRLRSATPDDATVARWGGDEFVIVLPGHSHDEADQVGEHVQAAFRRPVASSVGQHLVRFSVGCSTVTGAATVDELLQPADEAMFGQKQGRRGRRAVSAGTLRTIETALSEGRLEVWYQPIVSLERPEAELIGCEALLRMRDESGSLILPNSFVSEIQASQLGSAVDRYVLATALEFAAGLVASRWVAPTFQVSVNCGESFLRDASSVDFVEEQVGAVGLRGENLVLEISEQSTILGLSMIDRLRARGVGIAIDDVGLSHSNLDRLVDSNANIAKLDRRWLRVDDDHHHTGIVLSHLVPLCQDLGLTIIAEGVESTGDVASLRERGVRLFQGHQFGQPAPADDFAEALQLFGPDERPSTRSVVEPV